MMHGQKNIKVAIGLRPVSNLAIFVWYLCNER